MMSRTVAQSVGEEQDEHDHIDFHDDRSSAADTVEPLVEAIRRTPELATGHCRIALRAPRAVLLPKLMGLNRGVAHHREESFRGGDASIPMRNALHADDNTRGQCAATRKWRRALRKVFLYLLSTVHAREIFLVTDR
jgi:hypothetical protein